MIKTLNLAVLRLDGETQARLALSQEKVQEYAALMEDGEEFRPVEAFFDGSDYWLADGFHRYFATKANKKTSIAVTIHNGTLEEAQLFAFSANKGHGLHMSATDIRHCIVRMLEHPVWGSWSNAAIAKHVGTSKMTVGRVKAAMSEPEEETTEKKYVNKHGQEKTMQTAKIGRQAKPAAAPPPEPEQDDKAAELADTINHLAVENQKLKDAIAIGAWDATDIEKEDAQETIAALREEIRVLEIEVKTLRESRDMFQSRNAEMMRTVKSLQAKLKKLGQ
jgi:hypothetical protein